MAKLYTIAICPACGARNRRQSPFTLGTTFVCHWCGEIFTVDSEVEPPQPRKVTKREQVFGAAVFGALLGGVAGAGAASVTGFLIGAAIVAPIAALLAHLTFKPDD